MLRTLRSLPAFALAAFAVLAFATTASAQTPVNALQQLPDPHDCISTIGGESPECQVIAGGTTGATAIDVTPDGKHAYVVASGAGNSGSLATFSRNTSTGELSFDGCRRDESSGENCATQDGFLSGASHVVATNGQVYVASATDAAVRGFARNTTTGVLTPMSEATGCVQEAGAGDCVQGTGLTGVQHLAISPDGAFLYASSPTSDAIVVIARNTTTGALTYVETTTQADVRAATVSPDGANLYAVSEAPTSILVVYDRDPDGTLTRVECFRGSGSALTACGAPQAAVNGLNDPQDVAVINTGAASNVFTVSGRADVSGTTGSTLTRFERDTTDGTLTHRGCLRDMEATLETSCTASEGLDDATSITARFDGLAFYVTAREDDAITSFTPATGASGTATRIDSVTDGTETGLNGVNEAAVTDDGEFLYSAADLDHAVAAFAIQYAPVCSDITRDDIPFETTVRFPPVCVDPNDRDRIILTAVSQPEPGEGTTAAVDGDDDDTDPDTIEYDPPDNYDDSTFFTYQVTDDQGNSSNTANVNVTVLPTGAPVISIADAAQSESDGTMLFTLQRSGPTATSHVVSYTTQNDTATAGQDYTTTAGTVTFDPDETQETITVPILGDNVDEGTERFRLVLTNATNNASISDNLGVGTIADDDTSIVSVGNATVAEDGGPALLTVSLSGPSDRTVTVTYSTANGTATAGSDYAAPAQNATVSFTPGDTSETISIPIVDDAVVERTEEFSVNLSGPTGGAQLGDAGGDVTITDDEVPTVSIGDAGVGEGDSGTRVASFSVTLSAATSSPVTVNYATSNGTATAGSDYTASSGTLTFTPGETTKTVGVPITGDTTEEPDETFTVTLSAPTAATIGDGSGTGTIQNDDRAPVEQPPPPPPDDDPAPPRTTIFVGDTGIAEGDAGTRNAVFTVALSQAATAPIGVDVSTANGTAIGGQDYLAGTGRVTFAPGETSKTVPIAVVGDTVPEGDETFTVRLSNATGADIVRGVGTATIANDDITRRLPGLRFTVTPARDLTLPHVFTVRGQVTLPSGVSPAEGCATGFVSAQYKNGGNTISTRRVVLNAQCRFTIRTPFNIPSRLRNARRLKLTVRFLGNRYLSPRRARAVFVRVR